MITGLGRLAVLLTRDAPPPRRKFAEKQPGPAPGKRARVLLIDDDPLFGRIMQKHAARNGIDLTWMQDARQLPADGPWHWDLCIMDYDLGAVTGPELVSWLGNRPGACPFLLISHTERTDHRFWPRSIGGFEGKAAGPAGIYSRAFALVSNGHTPGAGRS